MSVPLRPADVDTLRAVIDIPTTPEAKIPPGSVNTQGNYLCIDAPHEAIAPLQERLGRMGYLTETQEGRLWVTGCISPEHTPLPVRKTPDPVAERRARLERLRQLHEMPDAELLENPHTTDDRPVVRLRRRMRRRDHKEELRAQRRQALAERRQRIREDRAERRDRKAAHRAERRDRKAAHRAERRTRAIQQRAQHRRERVAARHVEWEHNADLAGQRELLKRQQATTPERKAAMLARLQAGVAVVAAAAITSLGSISTASVQAFMVKYANAPKPVAWGVEPAIIMLVVGITIARYILSRVDPTKRIHWSVTTVEYGALVASAAMAGIGTGPGAVVAPAGVAVVAWVASSLIEAAAEADPLKVTDTGQDTVSERRSARGVRRAKRVSSRTGGRHLSPAPTVVPLPQVKTGQRTGQDSGVRSVPAADVPNPTRTVVPAPSPDPDTALAPASGADGHQDSAGQSPDTGDQAVPRTWLEGVVKSSTVADAVRALRDRDYPRDKALDLLDQVSGWPRDTIRRTVHRLYSSAA